nr:MAG TPA: Flagellar and Swarming motility protein [Caudoviricetes sp.]
MANFISEKGLKNSVPVAEIATAIITLSNGRKIEVTNPIMQIVELFQFVENPKNRFLNIGGVMVNVNQIATMKWVTQNPIKGDV